MLKMDVPGMVKDVPAGLIACRADGAAVKLAALSPAAVDICAPEEICAQARLVLYLYQPREGGYARFPLKNTKIGPVWRENGATLTRFFFDDAICARAVARCLDMYARHVEIRGECGAAAWGAYLTGYPAEKEWEMPESPSAQWEKWFREMPPMPDASGRELALCLNTPKLWRAYLSAPIGEMLNLYARLRQIPRRILPENAPRRLYIGSDCCGELFPGEKELHAILDKAAREAVSITLVTAEMRMGDEARMDAILHLAQENGAECEINDWGVLRRAQELKKRPEITLGPRLNRRRKDPRLPWKAGYERGAELWRENSLNDVSFRARLAEWGVGRIECERCKYDYLPPEGPKSLHLPFYLCNLSLWCPLRALCQRGGRGEQSGGGACPRWCENNLLLYPDHLKLLGRFNGLWALDDRPWDTDFMGKFDRWVLNF